MPAFRNIRRSRRISRQPPRDPNTDEYDLYDMRLIYPSDLDASPSPPASTPDSVLPPAYDAGESEIEPESPPLRPRSSTVPAKRSSHSRKRDPNYIPRPPNAFMIFRSDLWNQEKIKKNVERDHRNISRIAGEVWNGMSPAQRAPYQEKADEAKRQHALDYPDYKYSPVYRKDKATKRKTKPDHTDKVNRCQQVARLMQRGFLGDALERELSKREASAHDDCESDESEYVEGSRRKRARKSSSGPQPTASSRPRHPRHVKAHIKEEASGDRNLHPSTLAPAAKEHRSPEPTLSTSPRDDDCVDGFVQTADIPHISIGDPAFTGDVQFTNPFTSHRPCDAGPPIHSVDPLTADSSITQEFLQPVTDEPFMKSYPSPEMYTDPIHIELNYDYNDVYYIPSSEYALDASDIASSASLPLSDGDDYSEWVDYSGFPEATVSTYSS